MTISKDKHYKTKDGRAVRILATDVKDKRFPVAAAVTQEDGEETHEYYTSSGQFFTERKDTRLDLVEVKPQVTRYYIVRAWGGFSSFAEADQARKEDDISYGSSGSVMKVTFTPGEDQL